MGKAKKGGAAAEAIGIACDLKTVLALEPGDRAQWLSQACKLASEGSLKVNPLFDILSSRKIVEGLSEKLGQRMVRTLYKYIWIFSDKQQRFLSSCALATEYGLDGKGIGADVVIQEGAVLQRRNGIVMAVDSADLTEDMMARCRSFVRENASTYEERMSEVEEAMRDQRRREDAEIQAEVLRREWAEIAAWHEELESWEVHRMAAFDVRTKQRAREREAAERQAEARRVAEEAENEKGRAERLRKARERFLGEEQERQQREQEAKRQKAEQEAKERHDREARIQAEFQRREFERKRADAARAEQIRRAEEDRRRKAEDERRREEHRRIAEEERRREEEERYLQKVEEERRVAEPLLKAQEAQQALLHAQNRVAHISAQAAAKRPLADIPWTDRAGDGRESTRTPVSLAASPPDILDRAKKPRLISFGDLCTPITLGATSATRDAQNEDGPPCSPSVGALPGIAEASPMMKSSSAPGCMAEGSVVEIAANGRSCAPTPAGLAPSSEPSTPAVSVLAAPSTQPATLSQQTKPNPVLPGWLPEGSACSICGKKVVDHGGVVCARRRPASEKTVGCGAAVCWRCMNKSKREVFGSVKTTKAEFLSLGSDAWWMHQACMDPEDEKAYFGAEDEVSRDGNGQDACGDSVGNNVAEEDELEEGGRFAWE